MTLVQPDGCLILIVDDVRQNLESLGAMLKQVGYTTTFASSGKQALERVHKIIPDLILLDLMMAEMSGLSVCEQLKADPKLAEIPVIFLTANQEKEKLLDAFAKGAVDYLTKPFNMFELLARIRTHLELKSKQEELKKSLIEQGKLVKQLEELAITDPLTGIWNRRYLYKQAEMEFQRAQRYHQAFSILMIDIDRFKRINDSYGHNVGDAALKALVPTVKSSLRKTDSFGRFGGEEFLLLLPETYFDTALAIAERIRKSVEKLIITAQEKMISITVSIGVSSYKLGDPTVETIIQRADAALYQAKNQGRNLVIGDSKVNMKIG
ncbi:diguanylate cyclase [Scytonema sp. UIC 10036]|uniref:diguanylate cyclase n=1 Tax=Scytonema sp. UIC 10036 TaxID=2304196 RepID=UPI0012DAA769|nr:diguanylate cyclase [Scytonema sp. UIC 10036]MUH00787.1 diguanylate cyclase [Scytonema sp. UIC 10036]